MNSSRARRLAVVALFAAAVGCAARESRPSALSSGLAARPSKAVQTLQSDLERIFTAPIMDRGVWGVDIRSLQTGERIYQLNAGRLMMPASNMKILTVATAADTLGWDYRYTTTLETSAPVNGGVLEGDLFIRSNGDPTINTRDGRADAVLLEWAKALSSAGIREIRGRVIGDDQAFDDEGVGPGWSWDYLEAGYAAPSGGLQFNENTAVLSVTPGAAQGETAVATLSRGTGLTLVSRATTGAAGSEDTIEYRRRIDAPIVEVSGSIPLGGKPVRRSIAVLNPTLFLAQAAKDAFFASGIPVGGPAADFDDVAAEFIGAGERRILATTQSPPLREIATVLMKVSQNLYAETLLKTMGAARGGLGTTSGGRAVARRTLTAWKIPEDSYVMSDGSGLSRYNYVSPETVVGILEQMYRNDKHRDAFIATLPIAGKDGTISTRMRRTRAEGNAVAKTGSIANVRSLSGYVKTRDSEMLVFSIIANDFVIPAANVTYIADLAVEVLANFTRR